MIQKNICSKDSVTIIRTSPLKNERLMDNALQSRIENILKRFDTKAVFFDLDGTLLDNNSYHLKSWIEYLKKIGRDIKEEEYNANINGRTNNDVIRYIYNREMSDEEILNIHWKKKRCIVNCINHLLNQFMV